MYNRYFGNTGRYVRVEDIEDRPSDPPVLPVTPSAPHLSETPELPPMEPSVWQSLLSGLGGKKEGRDAGGGVPYKERMKFDFGAILDAPANLRGTIKDRLPAAIDFGDILLVLVLLYLFLEEEEDEMLVVLGILLVLWVLPLFGKDS